ncbi:unnamed protein product [Thelazia callipaeda]|uniref:Secreted protein n=1 Tax=Thelazia callipaeda TaxID=103827 RepID=A0A0N5CM04_THECL|nr:unnamed protein product [Thelazia callipaeda]
MLALLLLLLLNPQIEGWINVDPINVRVLGPPQALPQGGIGTLWNFFGWGYSADTIWETKPRSFFSRNINAILTPVGPYEFGSFYNLPFG